MTGFDPRALRDAFGSFMTGVTVVTARTGDGDPVGFTANSFSSVSLDPPLLLVCPGSFLSSFSVFAECEHFAVNVLAEGQENISNTFASFKGDRFAKISHHTGVHDLPLIGGAVASFCCKTFKRVLAGDHAVLIGEVVAFAHEKGEGLGYVGGRYFSLGLERAGASPDLSICGAIIEKQGKALLEKAPEGYHPVQFKADWTAAQRDLLEAKLIECGITADINQVYSSFSGEGGRTSTYFLATAETVELRGGLEWIPVSSLPHLRFATPAIGQMMKRYALEAQTRNFSLYIGDAVRGDIHTFS